jgi:formylglycine-generating enzyme required for sulfatase activity
LQVDLAELSREFTQHENVLNRELQVRLVELTHAAQAQQGEISRAFAEKIELFKADLQKYLFDKQRELQLELKDVDIALARELRQFDRATAISVIAAQKRGTHSPLWVVVEDLLSRGNTPGLLPLHIFCSPPTIAHDPKKDTPDTKGFPNVEQHLEQELRRLFQHYESQGRSTDYIARAWTSKQYGSESAARQIFLGLKSEPTLILESTLDGENLSISFAYWGLGYVKERYETLMTFSWLEALYDIVKERTEIWFSKRTAEGTTEAEWIAEYSEEFVRKYQANQAIIEREQRWLERGEDLREMHNRNYHIVPRDWDELKRLVSLCHCTIAGWISDEYFLLDVNPNLRQMPLLPDILPKLLTGMSESVAQQFIDTSVNVYQRLYQQLLGDMPDWEAELRLELATSLIKLPSREIGIAEINASITAWLAARGIDWQPPEPVLPLLAAVAQPEDEPYLQALYNVWKMVGITDEVNMGKAYYRRGEDFFKRGDYGAATSDFDRSLHLGYAEAAQGRNMVLRFQEHVTEQLQLQQQQQAAAAESQRVEELNRQLQVEQQEKAALEVKLQEQANLFAQMKQRWDAEEAEKQAKIDLETKQGKPFDFQVVGVNSSGEIIQREQKQARSITTNLPQGATLERVYIPGGEFLMGSADGVGNASEHPQHQVTIAPFFMSKYPVTQAQWRAVASLPQEQRNLNSAPSHFKGDNRPVESVSWHDAVEFCARLSKSTGNVYRLPSEAEWEYACRAETTTPYYFGETITEALANTGSETTDVGIFPPNNFGLYDLHGNVWEWCADIWSDSYAGAPTDGSIWEKGNNSHSPLRGGSWYNIPDFCRSAYRNNNTRDYAYDDIGFRIVCE